jgi:hypothetical protein
VTRGARCRKICMTGGIMLMIVLAWFTAPRLVLVLMSRCLASLVPVLWVGWCDSRVRVRGVVGRRHAGNAIALLHIQASRRHLTHPPTPQTRTLPCLPGPNHRYITSRQVGSSVGILLASWFWRCCGYMPHRSTHAHSMYIRCPMWSSLVHRCADARSLTHARAPRASAAYL